MMVWLLLGALGLRLAVLAEKFAGIPLAIVVGIVENTKFVFAGVEEGL